MMILRPVLYVLTLQRDQRVSATRCWCNTQSKYFSLEDMIAHTGNNKTTPPVPKSLFNATWSNMEDFTSPARNAEPRHLIYEVTTRLRSHPCVRGVLFEASHTHTASTAVVERRKAIHEGAVARADTLTEVGERVGRTANRSGQVSLHVGQVKSWGTRTHRLHMYELSHTTYLSITHLPYEIDMKASPERHWYSQVCRLCR